MKLILSVLLFFTFTLAQSDFEITQNFKNELKKVENGIKDAKSNQDLDNLETLLDAIKNDFSTHKALLDKALYPVDFIGSINKLYNSIEVRRGDFIQISELSSEIGVLKDHISELNEQNTDLIRKIRTLERSQKHDAKTIDSLKTLVKTLRASLRERDDLVFSMVDSLLADIANNPADYENADNATGIAKLDKKNIFANIKNTISDNIKFLEVTVLTPDDFSEIKEQQNRFSKLWKQVGNKVVNIYAKKKDRTEEANQINSYFREWNYRIDKNVWGSINKLFKDKNVNLRGFDQGLSFTTNVTLFIEDEIKSVKLRDREEVVNTYKLFADTLWYDQIKANWVPMLIDNNLLTEAQKDTIESKIEKWKVTIDPDATPTWIYFVIAGVVIIAFAFIFFQNKKSKKTE